MIEDTLARIGFSPSEIKAYMYLLLNGSSYPNKISAETKINRTNIYEALDRLSSKGVVSFITKNNIKWFEAKSPNSVFSLIKEKEEELNLTKDILLKDIKNLKPNINKNPLEANIFVGKKGLRMIFEEILANKKPVSFLASELQFKTVFGPYFDLWHKMRIEKKIKQRTIFPESFKSHLEKRELLEYAFVDDKFTNPTTTIIYGDCCVFIQWSDEPISIRINNRDIAKSHLNYFNLLWKTAKK